MNRSKLTFILLFASFWSFGQYGNEWIDFNQTYFKLKVVEDGFYRVTATELEARGFPTSMVPANRIQLFRRGQEVAINVNSSGGILDYLEFYGEKNKGDGDTELYLSPEFQPHTEYSLFTDTATYFLTWKLTAENGARMGLSTLNDPSGLTAEDYHREEAIELDVTDYGTGIKFGSGSAFSLADYDNGEGWTGDSLEKGDLKDFVFRLQNYYQPETTATLEVVLVGRNTLSHNVDILAGPNETNLRNVGNIQFSNRATVTNQFDFNESDLDTDGTLVVRVLATGFAGASERISPSMVRVIHPQAFDMSPTENKIFNLETIPSGQNGYVRIGTASASNTRVFEISDPLAPRRLVTTNFSDRLECIVPGPETNRRLIAVTDPQPVANILATSFQEIQNADFTIVTHPKLRDPASDGLDPIQAYADYRASAAGGSLSTHIASIFQVFDQFNYGDASPVALNRMADFLFDTGSPQGLFLIGKGRTTDGNFYRDNNHVVVNIPTYGNPGGDLMYVRGLGADPISLDLQIGRLNAGTTEDVKSYLDKVKANELRPFDNLNRKNVLQLSGGQDSSELSLFKSYIDDFKLTLEGDFLGGKGINVGKETSNAVEVIDVVKEVNDGVGLITFFGHSSGAVTDIEIGRVSDAQFGYANQGNYPVMLVNGCNAGNIFGTFFTFGEDWMITPGLGALAVIAHSDFASSTNLKRWSDLFYEVSFTEEAGFSRTLGEIMLECSNRYLSRFGTSTLAQTQVYETVLQGDPMIQVFGATAPDYEVTDERIWIGELDGEPIMTNQETFDVNFLVRNFGRTITDSLVIQIQRTLPQGEIIQDFVKVLRPLREDTISVSLTNDLQQVVAGLNVVEIFLDPENQNVELNEGNNYARIEFQIFEGNTANLYPPNYSIYQNGSIDFHWQPTNIFEESRGYSLEIDTVKTFNSSYLKSLSESGAQLLGAQVNFSTDNLPDTTTVYWRTRFASPENTEEEQWQNSSFTLINASNSGWGQFTQGQFEEDQMVGIEYGSGEDWEFATTDSPIDIITFGTNFPSFNYDDLRVIANGIDYLVTSNTIDPRCASNTINALIFDKESTNPYRPIAISGADVFNPLVCGRLPQMVYNLTETEVLGANARLETLIDRMEIGDHILLFNIGNVNYSSWDADVLAALEMVGIGNTLISSLTDGQPVIILGRKGDSPGSATAVLNDGSATPITQQSIQLLSNVAGSFTSGSLTTEAIGPARAWHNLDYELDENPEDNTIVTVIGIRPDGTEDQLFQNARLIEIDLSAIDASIYPRLKLAFEFSDETNLTPPQLDHWLIEYDYPPEGIILSESQETETLLEGQEIEKQFDFFNLSPIDFSDSLDVTATMRSNSGASLEQTFKIGPPVAGDTTSFIADLETAGQGGLNSLFTEVTANENELYSFNNQVNFQDAFNIQADETNPIIDVTFDGAYIMNGDIVSPEPTIVIQMKDDNSFLFKDDTLGMDVQLKRPCEGCSFERIHFTDPTMQVLNATDNSEFEITYTPEALEDGVYSLSVQMRDKSGNPAGDEPYQVDFEVVSESTITHFYPYPNPFSTSTRFVFTLTGTQIPDRLKIQVMTISGRVVREINQDEIGPIKVGHNITEFAWDGTDEFGDQLANGVYFYRVIMESDGGAIDHRATSADGAFKNGFGKLYILR